ncbi:MAG: sulfur oxidation c-type cytochrome SoxX [Betaproteobacteria bacterium]|jgi:sulfur-oxidizing protein SoxX|nr:sulfur oxidation c-type cytochrome SoxX [Betaproteobacteria bacterium]
MKKALIAAAAGALVVAGCASMKEMDAKYDAEVVQWMKRDFHARGIATMDRLDQDEVQRVCTQYDNKPPEAMAKQIEAGEMKKIKLPSDGKYMGDWKAGQKIAQRGRGMTWRDKPGSTNGGSCYNCHQLSTAELSFGTIGPSLNQFGKKRGYTVANQKYVYEKIYDSKAFTACSNMPRLGLSGTLTEQQIKDVTAYLMDPNSPVNK